MYCVPYGRRASNATTFYRLPEDKFVNDEVLLIVINTFYRHKLPKTQIQSRLVPYRCSQIGATWTYLPEYNPDIFHNFSTYKQQAEYLGYVCCIMYGQSQDSFDALSDYKALSDYERKLYLAAWDRAITDP